MSLGYVPLLDRYYTFARLLPGRSPRLHLHTPLHTRHPSLSPFFSSPLCHLWSGLPWQQERGGPPGSNTVLSGHKMSTSYLTSMMINSSPSYGSVPDPDALTRAPVHPIHTKHGLDPDNKSNFTSSLSLRNTEMCCCTTQSPRLH